MCYLGLDLVSVALGQLFLAGGRDQDVTVGLQDASFVRRRVREAHDGPVGLETENKQKADLVSSIDLEFEVKLQNHSSYFT